MRLLGYGVVATALHIALLMLIIQRRDLVNTSYGLPS